MLRRKGLAVPCLCSGERQGRKGARSQWLGHSGPASVMGSYGVPLACYKGSSLVIRAHGVSSERIACGVSCKGKTSQCTGL